MRTGAVVALAMLAGTAPLSTSAGENCRCRANGQFFDLGDTVCIRTPAGLKLAQCQMALNNTSWTVVRDSCPTARSTPLSAKPERLARLFRDAERDSE
jgi:hypothetical protein